MEIAESASSIVLEYETEIRDIIHWLVHDLDKKSHDSSTLSAFRRQLLGHNVEQNKYVSLILGNRKIKFKVIKIEDIECNLITRGTVCQSTNFIVRPSATYGPIPGYERQVQELTEEIGVHFQQQKIFNIAQANIIYVYGVRGVGKTQIVNRAVSSYSTTFGDMLQILVNSTGSDEYMEMELEELTRGSLLVIRNFEAIADSSLSDESSDAISQVTRWIRNLPKKMLVIIESNIPLDAMPAAVKKCISARTYAIPVPVRIMRAEIIKSIFSDFSQCKNNSRSTTANHLADKVASSTPGYVANDLKALCRQAFLIMFRDRSQDHLVKKFNQLLLGDAVDGNIKLPEWTHFSHALQVVRPSQQMDFESVLPKVNWSDIGGYKETVKVLHRFITLATMENKVSRLGIKPPSGILLYGPTGCGKTTLALAMITESKCNAISIKGSELFSKYLGETESRLRRIFQAARAASPCVIFMDEVDSIAAKREWASVESGGPSLRVLSTLLNEMDGVHDSHGVIVIGCTNQLDKIDDAILRPGRFDQLIEVKLPAYVDRLGILQILGNRTAVNADLENIARSTEGYSAANLEQLFRDAGMTAMRRDLDSDTIQSSDIEYALSSFGDQETVDA